MKLFAELVEFLAQLRYHLIPNVVAHIRLRLAEFLGKLPDRHFTIHNLWISGQMTIGAIDLLIPSITDANHRFSPWSIGHSCRETD